MREFEFEETSYHKKVHLIVGGTSDEVNSRLDARYGEEEDEDRRVGDNDMACVLDRDSKGKDKKRHFYLWISKYSEKKEPYHSLLIHELFHLTAIITEYSGIKLCGDSEEAFAYLQENLHREIKKRLIKVRANRV